jgi:hypothetical protein
MEPVTDEEGVGGSERASSEAAPGALLGAPPGGLSVYEASFPPRVAAFLRYSPVIEAAQAARRRGWADGTYDIVTLALTAIDLVVSRQGFEEEATRTDVVSALTGLAALAAPDRAAEEHTDVARFVIDFLLNRQAHHAKFHYQTSDYSSPERRHRRREVPFSLLEERDDAARDENVLRATADAINALIGGLNFDVEDEQVATELVLERQLQRNAFDSAVASAERARLLSLSLSDELDRLIKQTRRDLRMVEGEWASEVPGRLDGARGHIQDRLRAERALLGKVQDAIASGDSRLLAAARRIADLLTECQRRHEDLHRRVIDARGVFLEEQERQSFRPPASIILPDPHRQVFLPALELTQEHAIDLAEQFVTDMWGPVAPRLPRLYRLVNDLWQQKDKTASEDRGEDDPELSDPPLPLIREEFVAVALRAVRAVGLPARLSKLLAACEADDQVGESARRSGGEVLNLAVLWAFSPEEADDEGGIIAGDLVGRILGPRAAVDSDGTPLALPGWEGDDVIVAPDSDSLASALPVPEMMSQPGGRTLQEVP